MMILSLGGCDAAGDQAARAATPSDARRTPGNGLGDSVAQRSIGRRFTGLVTMTTGPAGSATRPGDSGPASASFEASARPEATFRLEGNAGNGNFRLEVPGRFDPSGEWRGRDDTVSMIIDPDGRISGSGNDGQTRLALAGRIDRRGLQLEVQVEPLAAGAEQRTVAMRYDLRTQPVAARPERNTPDPSEQNCARVVWRLKTVANMSGGPMQTVRVPECVDDR